MTNLVVHVDEPAKVATAISNVQNFLAARPTSTVVVVVNGPATLVTGAWKPLQQTLPQVEIDACHNAMVSHQMTAAQLPASVTVVPAGVVRIVDLQAVGYAYLRP